MKHVVAAIYISFGFLFYFIQGFEGFFGPDNMDLYITLFFIVGFIYFAVDLFTSDTIKKWMNALNNRI